MGRLREEEGRRPPWAFLAIERRVACLLYRRRTFPPAEGTVLSALATTLFAPTDDDEPVTI
jgi:hypothetical protein